VGRQPAAASPLTGHRSRRWQIRAHAKMASAVIVVAVRS
jgi:hypothetical protein